MEQPGIGYIVQVEIDDEHVPAIIEMVSGKNCMLIAAIKRAIITELTKY